MTIEDDQTTSFGLKIDLSKMPDHDLKTIAAIFYNLSKREKPSLPKEGPEPIGDIVTRVIVDIARRVDLRKQISIIHESETPESKAA